MNLPPHPSTNTSSRHQSVSDSLGHKLVKSASSGTLDLGSGGVAHGGGGMVKAVSREKLSMYSHLPDIAPAAWTHAQKHVEHPRYHEASKAGHVPAAHARIPTTDYKAHIHNHQPANPASKRDKRLDADLLQYAEIYVESLFSCDSSAPPSFTSDVSRSFIPKYLHDDTYDNKAWAQVSHGLFKTDEVNQMESELLHFLGYKLYVSKAEWEAFTTEIGEGMETHVRASRPDSNKHGTGSVRRKFSEELSIYDREQYELYEERKRKQAAVEAAQKAQQHAAIPAAAERDLGVRPNSRQSSQHHDRGGFQMRG
ncbi:hypothetical protein SeLEV6574_g01928 [Synchytrium endobioticum]|nr:hypothetical protein SeLEV6574_g01928 [Synchytrium endobioticum]